MAVVGSRSWGGAGAQCGGIRCCGCWGIQCGRGAEADRAARGVDGGSWGWGRDGGVVWRGGRGSGSGGGRQERGVGGGGERAGECGDIGTSRSGGKDVAGVGRERE